MRKKSLVLAVSLILSAAMPAGADEIVRTIELGRAPHPDSGFSGTVFQSFIVVTASESLPDSPASPSICYVLSPGGGGKLGVFDGQISSTNFLVRSRHLLAGAAQLLSGHDEAIQDSCVVVLDAATDFLFRPRGLRDLRRSDERMFDIAAVIGDLRGPPPGFGSELKIVLVGTSRGTIDMAEFAARVGAEQLDVPVHALVETATLTDLTGATDNVFNVPLDQVRVPTALFFHKDDACPVTPPEDNKLLKAQLINAPRIRVRGFKGGFPPVDSNPCQATTFHGFLGKEPDVVRAMTRWVSQVLR